MPLTDQLVVRSLVALHENTVAAALALVKVCMPVRAESGLPACL